MQCTNIVYSLCSSAGLKQQQWEGGGFYQLLLSANKTLCVDLPGASPLTGNQLQLWPCAEIQQQLLH
jgi:hypothetical protein